MRCGAGLYGGGGPHYGTGVGESAASAAAGGVHGFPAVLTSFIGRAGPAREVAGLLEEHRLVTVTGPGGVGKTRLAGEVARAVAGRFADGAWLAELAPVQNPAQVPAVVAAALRVREQPGVPAAQVLARVLARQQLLLVLDNCEHVIGAAAQMCAGLLAACDDMRVLTTSREPLRLAGEARYRLEPLGLPGPDDPEAGGSEAVALFADRARQVDARFALDGRTGPVVAMLETLRAYGAGLLAAAGEQDGAAAALGRWAVEVAEEAAAGLQTVDGELAAARWLDAEDATMAQVLAWAMDHDADVALRLAVALAPWWFLRGRLAAPYQLLGEVAGRAEPGSAGWCAARFWLGTAARFSADLAGALGHFTAVRNAVRDQGPSRVLADALTGRSSALRELGRARRGGRRCPQRTGPGPGGRLPRRGGAGPDRTQPDRHARR